MPYIAAHARGLLLLLLLFQATGTLVARALPALDHAGRRTGLMRVTAGMGVWMYGLFALAALQLLYRRVLIGAVIAVFAGAAAVAWRLPGATRGDCGDPRSDGRWGALPHAIAWIPLGVVLAALFMRALVPWIGSDDSVYHLTLPKIYLANHGFRRLPFNVYSNWPLNPELLYGLAMALGDYVLAKLVHVACLGLLTVAVYRFAARTAAPWAGLAAASLLLANDVVLVEAPSANVDIAVAFLFFMAATLAIEFRQTGDRASLVLAGVFCGLVAGSKVTGFAAVACVFPLVAMASLVHASDRRLWRFTEDTALFLAPALALAAPWLIKSFVYTGDPLYPILWKYLGGVEWSDTLSDQFWRWQRSIGMGRTCRDFLLLPVRVILFGGGDYGHFAAWISKSWILLIPLTVIASPLIPIVRWCLIPAALYFAVWALGSQQTRFLIAVLPLLAAAAGITLSRIVTGVNRWLAGRDTQGQADTRLRMLGHVLAGSVVAGCLVILAWASRYVVPVAVALSHDLRANPPTLQTWTPDPVFSYIRENLPASARVMLLNTNQAFFVDRDYIADSFFEASQLNALIREAVDREGLTALFERLTITHVLFKEDEPWVQFPPALRQYLSDRATATRIYASPGGAFTLYELRARAPVTHALGFERAGGRGSRVRRARADTHRREVEARFRPEMDIRVG